MKRYLLIALVTFNFNFAYSQWVTIHHDADPMNKTGCYDSYSFTDSVGNKFIMWSDSDKRFRLISSEHIFNYNAESHMVFVNVGFYDERDNFIEKVEIDGHVNKSEPTMLENQFSSKKVKKIISYIKEQKGSVRFRVPLYGKAYGLDFIVKCLNNEVKGSR